MAVEIVKEEPQRPPLRLVAPPDPINDPVPPTPLQQEIARKIEIIGVLTGIAEVLGIRLILMMVGVGAFVLALIVVLAPTVGSIVSAAFYDVGVVAPMAWLTWKKG